MTKHAINREALTHDPQGILKQLRETAQSLGMTVLTEHEQEAMRKQLLKDMAPQQDLWLFAYGSLIWNPTFHFVEARTGKLQGWHRDFCIHLPFMRGTPEKPGLMMGLQKGGDCVGRVYRIAKEAVAQESKLYFRREMNTDVYLPTWLKVETAEGIVSAVALITNTKSCRYQKIVSLYKKATIIAQAEGFGGTNREYLFNTLASLEALNISDPLLEKLAIRVRELLICERV